MRSGGGGTVRCAVEDAVAGFVCMHELAFGFNGCAHGLGGVGNALVFVLVLVFVFVFVLVDVRTVQDGTCE